MKSVLVYDGSFKGLLTCIYRVFDRRLKEVDICKRNEHTPEIFRCEDLIDTRLEDALKVWNALKVKAGSGGADRIYRAFLSELKGAENCILDYIITAYQQEHFNPEDTGLSCVKKINYAAAMVSRSEERNYEQVIEHLEGTRQKWVSLRPDFNVLPLLAKRLQREMGEGSWVLYDHKREYGFHNTNFILEPVYHAPVQEAEEAVGYPNALLGRS